MMGHHACVADATGRSRKPMADRRTPRTRPSWGQVALVVVSFGAMLIGRATYRFVSSTVIAVLMIVSVAAFSAVIIWNRIEYSKRSDNTSPPE